MIALSLEQLAQVVGGKLLASAPEAQRSIGEVTTDTRKVTAGALFIALRGERFDAHDFAAQAQEQGAAALLVERELPLAIAQIVVADTRLALGQLGHWV
ncbi:MAG: Mur ligase domain-containing protein, partial [Plesiomonas shigelloides]